MTYGLVTRCTGVIIATITCVGTAMTVSYAKSLRPRLISLVHHPTRTTTVTVRMLLAIILVVLLTTQRVPRRVNASMAFLRIAAAQRTESTTPLAPTPPSASTTKCNAAMLIHQVNGLARHQRQQPRFPPKKCCRVHRCLLIAARALSMRSTVPRHLQISVSIIKRSQRRKYRKRNLEHFVSCRNCKTATLPEAKTGQRTTWQPLQLPLLFQSKVISSERAQH